MNKQETGRQIVVGVLMLFGSLSMIVAALGYITMVIASLFIMGRPGQFAPYHFYIPLLALVCHMVGQTMIQASDYFNGRMQGLQECDLMKRALCETGRDMSLIVSALLAWLGLIHISSGQLMWASLIWGGTIALLYAYAQCKQVIQSIDSLEKEVQISR